MVRAKIFDDQNGEKSPTITRTYFVDEAMTGRYSLPIISLVTENENLFDYRTGIYIMGQIYDLYHHPGEHFSWMEPANYNQRGMEWERPVHFELFEEQGKPGISRKGPSASMVAEPGVLHKKASGFTPGTVTVLKNHSIMIYSRALKIK